MQNIFLLLSIITLASTQCSNNMALVNQTCQCPSNLYYINDNCTDSCPTNYYLDTASNQCVPCARGCAMCTNNTREGCIMCINGFAIDSVTGFCECLYPTITEIPISLSCPDGHSTSNYNATHKQCLYCSLRICEIGQYFDSSIGRCTSCGISNCESCIKGSSIRCLACTDPYFFNTDFTCTSTCTGVAFGNECGPAYCSTNQLYDPLANDCVDSCQASTDLLSSIFVSLEVCGSCDSACKSSTGTCYAPQDPNACNNCGGANVGIVRSATYVSPRENEFRTFDCVDIRLIPTLTNLLSVDNRGLITYYYCSPECATCSGSIYYCLSCNPGSTLFPDGSCRPDCNPPYVLYGDYCVMSYALQDNSTNNTNGNNTSGNNTNGNNTNGNNDFANVTNTTTELANTAKAAAVVTNVGSVTVSTFVLASQILNPGTSFASTRTQSLNMLLYLRYLNIDYPTDLSNKFNDSEPSTYQINFEFPETWIHTEDEFEAPERYSRYEVSPQFLINFWGNIITCAIILGVTVPLAIMVRKKITIQNMKLKKVVGWTTDIFVWNYIISFVFSSLGDAFFFIIVQYQSYNGPEGSINIASMVFSCLLTIMIIIVGPYYLIKHYEKVWHALKSNSMEKVTEKMAGSKVIFEDFKYDSRLQLYFLLIYSVRIVLYMIFIAVIPQSPLSQSVILALLNGVMLIYMLVFWPFDSMVNNSEIIFYEIGLFATNVMTSLLADCKEKNDCSQERIDNIVRGILAINIILTIGSICYSVYNMLLSFVDVIQYFRKKRRLRITPGDMTSITFNTLASVVSTPKDESAKRLINKLQDNGTIIIDHKKSIKNSSENNEIQDEPNENKENKADHIIQEQPNEHETSVKDPPGLKKKKLPPLQKADPSVTTQIKAQEPNKEPTHILHYEKTNSQTNLLENEERDMGRDEVDKDEKVKSGENLLSDGDLINEKERNSELDGKITDSVPQFQSEDEIPKFMSFKQIDDDEVLQLKESNIELKDEQKKEEKKENDLIVSEF